MEHWHVSMEPRVHGQIFLRIPIQHEHWLLHVMIASNAKDPRYIVHSMHHVMFNVLSMNPVKMYVYLPLIIAINSNEHWITTFKIRITWPLIGSGSLTCDGVGACVSVFSRNRITETEPLNITCNGNCQNTWIYCPEYAPCNVQCNNPNGCYLVCYYLYVQLCPLITTNSGTQATIVWPLIEGYGTLTCNGSNSIGCYRINYPELPTSTQPYNITCSGDNTCQYSQIYCPSAADCTLNCDSEDGCANVCGPEIL